MKIVHLTSVHPRFDTRIYYKMCKSLALNGYNVSLVVADGKGDEVKDGVSIVDVGATTGGRLSRMIKTCSRVFEKAKELDGDIYHVHGPELIRIDYKLIKKGKKVIFNSYEDICTKILNKPYLNSILRKLIYISYNIYDKFFLKKLGKIIIFDAHKDLPK